MVNGAHLTIYFERICICTAPGRGAHGNDNEFACAPRPGAAHMAMTVVDGAYLKRLSERIRLRAAPGRRVVVV
eukprot:1456025-Karenia_brevis.AAC.1